mgnify:CR=1 FL=1
MSAVVVPVAANQAVTNPAVTNPAGTGPRASLERVFDPEIPVLTIGDLGVLRTVTVDQAGHVEVVITPTYSGCPAMDAIRDDIVTALATDGFTDVTVRTELAPAWSTDDITDRGRQRLREFGIAPPHAVRHEGPVPLTLGFSRRRTPSVVCPRCASSHTREISRFSSTACKAHYVCQACHEPFDYFKEL